MEVFMHFIKSVFLPCCRSEMAKHEYWRLIFRTHKSGFVFLKWTLHVLCIIHVQAKVSESICFLFRVLQTCHDDASKFLHLLAKPGCSYLEQEDFIPFLQVWGISLERSLLNVQHVMSSSLKQQTNKQKEIAVTHCLLIIWERPIMQQVLRWFRYKELSSRLRSFLMYRGSLITLDIQPNNMFSKCFVSVQY